MLKPPAHAFVLIASAIVLLAGAGCKWGPADIGPYSPAEMEDRDARGEVDPDSAADPQREPAVADAGESGDAPPDTRPMPAPEDDTQAERPTSDWVEAFPHVRVNTSARAVEFDTFVSPLIRSGYEGEIFYLEQFVCRPHTKEHESLVVSRAEAAHVHAALLLIALEPGRPAFWNDRGEVQPSGPTVRVRFRPEGSSTWVHPAEWTKPRRPDGPDLEERDFVFAGSRRVIADNFSFYEGDAAGTVVGLASFGSETISWPTIIEHDEASGDLQWIADPLAVPEAETPVVVRITAIE